jgi:hypothetical protein
LISSLGIEGENKPDIKFGKSLAADRSRSISDICQTLKILSATYYRYIHQAQK